MQPRPSRWADRLLWYDGIGLCMLTKKLKHGQFVWPSTTTTGRNALTPQQTAASDDCDGASGAPQAGTGELITPECRSGGIDLDTACKLASLPCPTIPPCGSKCCEVVAVAEQHTPSCSNATLKLTNCNC